MSGSKPLTGTGARLPAVVGTRVTGERVAGSENGYRGCWKRDKIDDKINLFFKNNKIKLIEEWILQQPQKRIGTLKLIDFAHHVCDEINYFYLSRSVMVEKL